jgi:hypothetical protein
VIERGMLANYKISFLLLTKRECKESERSKQSSEYLSSLMYYPISD